MLRSMTGFGAASTEVDGTRYAVEIRSVNNKYFKAQLRVPEELLALEAEVESALARRLARGSITATVRFDTGLANEGATLNADVVRRVHAPRGAIGERLETGHGGRNGRFSGWLHRTFGRTRGAAPGFIQCGWHVFCDR